jgi:hypothetical protein
VQLVKERHSDLLTVPVRVEGSETALHHPPPTMSPERWHKMTHGMPTCICPDSVDTYQPETGLGNEIWALAGYLISAHSIHMPLCLPPFTTNVHSSSGTSLVPFEELFDARRFIAGMGSVGVRVARRSECRPAHPRESGWMMYKKSFSFEARAHYSARTRTAFGALFCLLTDGAPLCVRQV